MLDEENRRYVTRKGYIKLSLTETYLLGVLIKNKGKVVLVENLLKSAFQGTSKRYIGNVIAKLRKKLKGELIIFTRHGAGYFIL